MTKFDLVLSLVTVIVGALGGTAGSHAMSKRNLRGTTSTDEVLHLVETLTDEIEALSGDFSRAVNAIHGRITAIESKGKPAPAKKSVAKKTTAPVKKAAPKK